MADILVIVIGGMIAIVFLIGFSFLFGAGFAEITDTEEHFENSSGGPLKMLIIGFFIFLFVSTILSGC